MLDQLVESKDNHSFSSHRRGYLVTTGLLVCSLFMSGIMWSLFARDLGMTDESLELSALVMPFIEEAPKPEPERPKSPEIKTAPSSALPTRTANIQRPDETPVSTPDISTSRNLTPSRPPGKFVIGKDNTYPPSTGSARNSEGEGTGINSKPITPEKVDDPDPEPPPVKKPEPKKEEPPVVKGPIKISEGPINGKATSLPKPNVTATMKALRPTGSVSVQVTIDEAGNVISARAVSGHPILRGESEAAARRAKFSPTYLGKQAVKVTGVIVYNFVF